MRAAVEIHVYWSPTSTRKQAWRWRAVARNGRIVADSGEGYATKAGAVNAAAVLVRFVGAGEVRIVVPD